MQMCWFSFMLADWRICVPGKTQKLNLYILFSLFGTYRYYKIYIIIIKDIFLKNHLTLHNNALDSKNSFGMFGPLTFISEINF